MQKEAVFGALFSIISIAFLARPLHAEPVYDPSAKSYFDLVDSRDLKANPNDDGRPWLTASALAKARVYKGVHGRLAIVKTVATHDFLERTFHPNNYTWIGLRYWCATRKLELSDGEVVTHLSFAAWDKNWNQDIYACHTSYPPGPDYMPIAYSPIQDGFRWIGKGRNKHYWYYLVEYPTGHP